MVTTIGIVGPSDLVSSTNRICADVPGIETMALTYQREADTPQVMAAARSGVDAWLFTGVMPHQIAASHDLLDRPAVHVEYTGPTLLLALVRLLRHDRNVNSMSIDGLTEAQVQETLDEAALPIGDARVLPYRPGCDSDAVVAFHREARRNGVKVAVTSLRSAYDTLRTEQPAIRLAPSLHSVRSAVHELLLTYGVLHSDDAQVALGLVEVAASAEGALREEVGALSGTVLRYDDRRFLVITARGPLSQVTASFTELGMLNRLKERFGPVRIGFGVGGSGAEAATLARRALARATTAGRTAAVVSLRNDIDFTLVGATTPRPTQRLQLQLLAQRTGLSKATLEKVQALVHADPVAGVTTRALANHLGVQPRAARRVLNRLERSGVARITGSQPVGCSGTGRPLVVYRVYL